MALAKSSASVEDWNAVAQNTIEHSTVYDFSTAYVGFLQIQAALDTTTAHTGTKFVVQVLTNTSGDEDWSDLTQFIELIGTAATDLIENNPLNATETSITLTAHALTVVGKWLLIEDSTLANSELVFQIATDTNDIDILDGVTNAHVATTAIFNLAFVKNIYIPPPVYKARVLVINTYDADGSTLNYRVRTTKVTGI